jgi:hypothetical protein
VRLLLSMGMKDILGYNIAWSSAVRNGKEGGGGSPTCNSSAERCIQKW